MCAERYIPVSSRANLWGIRFFIFTMGCLRNYLPRNRELLWEFVESDWFLARLYTHENLFTLKIKDFS